MNTELLTGGMCQYRDPFCFELTQQSLRLKMDDGGVFVASLIDGHSLFWTSMGGAATLAHYDCLKAAPEVYLVNFEMGSQATRENTTLVLDLHECLVTRIQTTGDPEGGSPAAVHSTVTFGVIDKPGFTKPLKRHRYTTRLMNKCVSLCASPGHKITQMYDSTETLRARAPKGCAWGHLTAEDWAQLEAKDGYQEQAEYIKIKDGLYVVCWDESNLIRGGLPGVSQTLLMDATRMLCVGRAFGRVPQAGGKWEEVNYLFGAYGDFMNPADY